MHEDELKENLLYLRNKGTDYRYIEGYEDGYKSELINNLTEYLINLRDTGLDYNYIAGFRLGYESINGFDY